MQTMADRVWLAIALSVVAVFVGIYLSHGFGEGDVAKARVKILQGFASQNLAAEVTLAKVSATRLEGQARVRVGWPAADVVYLCSAEYEQTWQCGTDKNPAIFSGPLGD